MISRIFLAVLLAAAWLSPPLLAQNGVLRGNIVDNDTGQPLGYAAVFIKGKNVGTVSNSDGNFEFHIPQGTQRDTLCVSMLGYHMDERLIQTLNISEHLIVRLKESPVRLNEVVVVGDTTSANTLFRKAMANISRTFPQDNYGLKGSYRQLNTENGKYVLLVEAAVEIFDKNYQLAKGFNLREKVVVNQARSSESNFKNTNRNYFEMSNTLTTLLTFNFSRYENKYLMERKNFTLDSVMALGDRTLYVISSKKIANNLVNRFTLYIDSKTFSIWRIMNENVADSGHFLQNFDVPVNEAKSSVLKLIASSQSYQFREYQGKMYLAHAESNTTGQIINMSDKSVQWTVTDENIIVVDEIVVGEGVQVPRKGLMDKGMNIRFIDSPYDPSFWRNPELIKLPPLTTKTASDLGSFAPLEEQFSKRKSFEKQ